jgi:UDP-GlcNAc:undecaprenyl-phosphate GlcNAc-1-phosphate transferase
MEILIPLAATGVLALLLSAAITPIVGGVARRRGWFDHPNARKVHHDLIPRLGGVAIFIAFSVSSLLATILSPLLFPGTWAGTFTLRALTVVAAVIIINGTGLVDDFSNLPALLKLCLQIASAALVTAAGYVIPLAGPEGSLALRILGWLLTMGWIVGVTNAMNLVDGMDGLAGGMTCIAALSLGVVALLHGGAPTALLAAALLGAVAGFLIYNFPPARIFMGDSGSYLIGFSLALIPLIGAAATREVGALLAPLVVLAVPILDTIAAILRRLHRRQPVHTPDREHIHHVLLSLGLNERTILAAMSGYCAYLGAMAVIVSLVRWQAAVAITVAVWAVTILLYSFLRARGKRAVALEASAAGRRAARARVTVGHAPRSSRR